MNLHILVPMVVPVAPKKYHALVYFTIKSKNTFRANILIILTH